MLKSILLLLCFHLFSNEFVYSQEQIIVDCSVELDPNTKVMQGFLHGGPQFLDSVLTAKLKPQFWRFGAYDGIGGGYDDVKKFNPKTTLVINDLFMIAFNIPSQTLSQPWTNNWNEWDTIVYILANGSVQNNKPIDYWDVWGEPDNFWSGNYSQWIEMYRRTDSILHQVIPTAKMTGPEFGFGACDFSVVPILQFLDNLHAVNSKVDGVSWHEFCLPQSVPLHVQELRDSLLSRPWASNLTIHIPEYAGPSNHRIPGWNVGWLYYLEKAKVDWASHGCWDVSDGVNSWSDCQFGLNSLFMKDGTTPQANYWVHRAYAELLDKRLETNSNTSQSVALASSSDLTEEMKIIVGRYDNPQLGSHNSPSNVQIKIKNYPYCSNCTQQFVIQRIPSNDVPYSQALNLPQTVSNGSITFTGDSTTISLPNFIDGDAYVLYVNPSDTSVLASEEKIVPTNLFSIYPNPCTDKLTVELNSLEPQNVIIKNTLGQVIYQQKVQSNSSIDISKLKDGFYFFSIEGFEDLVQVFIKSTN